MKKILTELPFNYFHFILLGIILFILSTKYIIVIIPFSLFLLYVFKERAIFKYIIGLVLLISIISLLEPKPNGNQFYGTVLEIEEKDRTNKLTLSTSKNNVIVYLDKNIKVTVGDYGYYDCTKSSSNSIYNGGFDYDEYLYNNYIDGAYYVKNYTYIKNKFVISKVQYNIKTYFESKLEDNTLKYSLMLILGIDTFDDQESDAITNLGIMHLFCISGMHINFILSFVAIVLSKFKVNNSKIEVVQIIFATILLIITNFGLSVIRAFLMFVLKFIFTKLKLKYTSLDILCISAILILIFKPRYIYLISFQLTYLVSFVIIITNDLYKNKSSLYSMTIQSIIAFAVTFPIIVNMNYEINFMSFIFTTFITIPFSYIIMPITFISALLSTNFFNPIFEIFNSLLFNLSTINIFIFRIEKLNIIYICIYYILITLVLKSVYIKKHITKLVTLLLCFLFIIINSSYLNNVTTVTFFDVGQGDSALISLPYNKANILIDCYNGVGDKIKTRGIKNIDYLIITHAHNDHMGDLDIILKEFNVKTTIGSYYDQDSRKLNLDEYVSAGDKIQIYNITLNFIAPYKSNADINHASLVFTTLINGYTFLFTGDTVLEVEQDIITKSNVKADVLKVPHHGSDTSSCIEFVNAVYPKYAIFSYGENNNYGIPDADVMSRYTMSINYHTPIHGSIEFYFKKEWLIRFYK